MDEEKSRWKEEEQRKMMENVHGTHVFELHFMDSIPFNEGP